MRFVINGETVEAEFDLRTSLLDLLRDHLDLHGSKKGCNQGACGACTVLVDGERILSCLALAVQYQGEKHHDHRRFGAGWAPAPAPDKRLSSMMASNAVIARPGQICSAIGMVAEAKRGMPSHVTRDVGGGARYAQIATSCGSA